VSRRKKFLVVFALLWAAMACLITYTFVYLLSIGELLKATLAAVLSLIALVLGVTATLLLRFDELEDQLNDLLWKIKEAEER